jgi:hypothetical protein
LNGPNLYDENVKLASVNFKKTHSSEQQRARSIRANAVKKELGNCNPTQIKYWVDKFNMPAEEAAVAVSKRQTTFTKDICIAKYGFEAGIARWQERQDKWKSSLKCSGLYTNPSKESLKLFTKISKFYPALLYGDNEQLIVTKAGSCFVDSCLLESKKIIEYFGDYWHANPALYLPNHQIKSRTAESIWEFDKRRHDVLVESGFEVLIIWGNDFKKNPDSTITRCINYLSH